MADTERTGAGHGPDTPGRSVSGRLEAGKAIELARDLGFDMAGVVTRRQSGQIAHFRKWLDSGLHGTMAYLERPDAVRRRARLDLTLPAFRSALVVAHSYAGPHPTTPPGDPSRAIVARYARGRDYHHVIGERLEELGRGLERAAGHAVQRRAYVDTGPLLERELASLAGLGWFGRNTMLIHPRRGSYFFLGVLLTDLPLAASAPFREDHCGTCRRCIDACPTGALLGRDDAGAPVMDAARCISYLTIELRGPIPVELRPAIGNRVFGCDICQEVCPWNEKFAVPTTEPAYAPRPDLDAPRPDLDAPRPDLDGPRPNLDGASLIDLATRLLDMSGKAFLRTFADSPVSRARRNGLLRNVCVALGNWGAPEAVPVLQRAARDRSDLVREHARWALREIGAPLAPAPAPERLDPGRQPEFPQLPPPGPEPAG